MSYLWKRVIWSVHPDTECVCAALWSEADQLRPFFLLRWFIYVYINLICLHYCHWAITMNQTESDRRVHERAHVKPHMRHCSRSITPDYRSNSRKLQDTFHIRQTHENLLVHIDRWTEINIKHNRVKFYICQSYRGRELYCRCAWVNESLSSCLCLCICTSTDTEWRPGWLYPPGPLLLVFDWKHESGSSVRAQNTITAHIIRDIL